MAPSLHETNPIDIITNTDTKEELSMSTLIPSQRVVIKYKYHA